METLKIYRIKLVNISRWCLKDEGGFWLLTFWGLALLTTALMGCTSHPVKSLCYMDFKGKVCWINKDKKQGISFHMMSVMQDLCSARDENGKLKHPNTSCWYGIDSLDLKRIHDKISR